MTNQQDRLDEVFHALADPTRRAILARLIDGPASVSELARPFGMAMPTLLAHIRVLEASRMVRSQKSGRVRTCRIDPAAIHRAEGWLAEQRLRLQAGLGRQLKRRVEGELARTR